MPRKRKQGRVLSAKSKDTVVVVVETRMRDRRCEKVVKRRKVLHAHINEEKFGKVEENQKVVIEESRPYSKMKRHVVVSVEKSED